MCRIIIFLLILIGCQRNTEPHQLGDQNQHMNRRDSLFEPLDKLVLASFLPDSVSGFVLKKTDAESTGGFGYKIVTVVGTYLANHDQQKIKLYISDASGAKSILGTGAWANLDFDKTNEYTAVLEGHKYYIKMNSKRKKGEINLLIKDRFVLQLKGTNVDSVDMNRVLNKTLQKNYTYFEK